MAGDFSISAACPTVAGQLTLGERGRPSRPILSAVSNAQWVDPDYLVFVGRHPRRTAVRTRDRTSGRGTVFRRPNRSTTTIRRPGQVPATSRTGNVMYQSHTDTAPTTWTIAVGPDRKIALSRQLPKRPRLSPDGGRVLVDRMQPRTGCPILWVLDLVRGGETRLTSDLTSESYPVWLRDGLAAVFMADRGGPPRLFRKNLLTVRRGRTLPAGRHQRADDVSPNGKTLAFERGRRSATTTR